MRHAAQRWGAMWWQWAGNGGRWDNNGGEAGGEKVPIVSNCLPPRNKIVFFVVPRPPSQINAMINDGGAMGGEVVAMGGDVVAMNGAMSWQWGQCHGNGGEAGGIEIRIVSNCLPPA